MKNHIFSGDLERLRRFWLTGTCNPKKEEKKASEPLAPEQFLSAFFLLLCGILLAIGQWFLNLFYKIILFAGIRVDFNCRWLFFGTTLGGMAAEWLRK